MVSLRKAHGFTIVELLITVTVITILATIGVVSYNNSQLRAADAQKRDALDKFADALMTWSAEHRGAMPYGGWNATGGAAYSSTTETCTNPGNSLLIGWQDYNMAAVDSVKYACTLGDALVASNYLMASFFTSLPKNPKSTNYGNFMVYTCPTDTTGATIMMMIAQQAPSQSDVSKFDANFSQCFATSYPNGGADTATVFHNTYGVNVSKLVTLYQ